MRVLDENGQQFDIKVFGNLPRSAKLGLQKGRVVYASGVIARWKKNHPKYLRVDYEKDGQFTVLEKDNSSAISFLSCIGKKNVAKETQYPVKSIAELKNCSDGTYSVKNCIVKAADATNYNGCANCLRKVLSGQLCPNPACANQKKKSQKMLLMRLVLADRCNERGMSSVQDVTLFGGNVAHKMMKIPPNTFLKKSPSKQRKVVSSELAGREFSYIEVKVTTKNNGERNLTVNDCGQKFRR